MQTHAPMLHGYGKHDPFVHVVLMFKHVAQHVIFHSYVELPKVRKKSVENGGFNPTHI